MAFNQYLTFDGTDIPMPDTYEVSMDDVEAGSSGTTEAGTTQRDVVRFSVHAISASFSVTSKWLVKLTAYKNQAKVTVDFFDPETAGTTTAEMYITDFKAKRKADTPRKGAWTVSFTLKEF